MIANNPQNIKFLNKYTFTKNDLVIIFNKSLFENHRSFQGAKKVMHFFRDNSHSYWGLEKIKICKCEKYFIQRSKKSENQIKFKNKLEKLLNDKIEIYDNFYDMEKKYYYNISSKSPMTGSLTFEALKEQKIINNNSNIYLVGFTCVYSRLLPKCHSKFLEDYYFKEQKKIYKNLYYLNNHINNFL